MNRNVIINITHALSWLLAAVGSLSIAQPQLFSTLPQWAQLASLAVGAYGVGRHQTAPKDAPTLAAVRASRLGAP